MIHSLMYSKASEEAVKNPKNRGFSPCLPTAEVESSPKAWDGALAEQWCMFLNGRENRRGNLRFGLKWRPVFAGSVCVAQRGMKAVLDSLLYLAEVNNQCEVRYKLLSVFELACSERAGEFQCSAVPCSFHAANRAHGSRIPELLYHSSSTTSASESVSFLKKNDDN